MAELRQGAVFAGYRIEEVRGRGGMGIVYRAIELGLERTVALKLIAPERTSDPDFRRRFEREARLAASIEHPNVLPVYAVGEADGLLYQVMRYVQGPDLRALLVHRHRLDAAGAVALVAQVAGALDAAHAVGLVHRDVKPTNVLLAGDDAYAYAYLADFGVARLVASSSTLTREGSLVGTVDYSAPEQLEGRPVDGRADVYSLGCVLYEALTGRIPFDRSTDSAKLLAHLRAPPPRASSVAGVPVELDAVVARALAKSPDERYASAGELARAATGALESGRAPRAAATADAIATAPDAVAPDAVALRPSPPRGRRPGPVTIALRGQRLLALGGVIAAIAAAAAAGATGGLLSRDGDEGRVADRVGPRADPGLPDPVIVRDKDPYRDRRTQGAIATAAQIESAVEEFQRAYAEGDWAGVRELLTGDISYDVFYHQAGSDFPLPSGAKGIGGVVEHMRRDFALRDTSSYRITSLKIFPGFYAEAHWRYQLRAANGISTRGSVVAGLRRRGRAVRFYDVYVREGRP